MSNPTRRYSRKQKAAIGVSVIMVCLGALVLPNIITNDLMRHALDAKTFCPEVITSHTVFLIDQTDALNERALLGLQHAIERTTKLVEEGGRLTVFRIEESSDKTMHPMYDACRPVSASEFTANLIVQKRRQDQFESSMQSLAQAAANATKSDYSPIVEMVGKVAQEIVAPENTEKAKIIVFSDMLQNSPRCTDYPHRQQAIGVECPPLPRMEGMTVDIHYILRPGLGAMQNQKHRERWASRFSQARASCTWIEEY